MARFDKLEFGKGDPNNPRRSDRTVPLNEGPLDQKWIRAADENRRAGVYESALRFYSRSLEVDKTLVGSWAGQVQMLILLREYPQADLWAKKALELFPMHPELFAGRAQARCRMGDFQQAAEFSDAALAQPGDSSYRWQVRGELMLARSQKTDAHCFDRAQQANSDWLVAVETSLIYLYYRMPSKAVSRSQKGVERQPSAHYAWYVLGLAQAEAGLAVPATNSFERCLELCPGHEDARKQMSELHNSSWSLFQALRRWTGR